MLWPHTKTLIVLNKHQTSRIVNFSDLPRISFYTICNYHLPLKAQAEDDRLQRIENQPYLYQLRPILVKGNLRSSCDPRTNREDLGSMHFLSQNFRPLGTEQTNSSAGISHIHFTESLLRTSRFVITRFHLNFKMIPAGSAAVPEKPPKSRAHTSRTRFFAPFWQTITIALHSFSPIFSSSTHHPGLAGMPPQQKCYLE